MLEKFLELLLAFLEVLPCLELDCTFLAPLVNIGVENVGKPLRMILPWKTTDVIAKIHISMYLLIILFLI